MSNINEEKDDGLGHGFHRNLKEIRQEQEEAVQTHKDWEQFDGLKPPRESLPEILTERGMHDEAKARTQRQNEEQAKLEKAGLVQSSRRSFGEKMEQAKGHDAIQQARIETRQEQSLQHKKDRERDI